MAIRSLTAPRMDVAHYHWAGLDFLVDQAGEPVFLEANRASHMLGEYRHYFQDERPFELTADVMNRAPGPPCLLWRRSDPQPDADEDACFIARGLEPHLREPPVICHVEDNQEPRAELIARDGRRVLPGSIFRWWYGLPWSYERSGATVINPNCLWVVVRDKLACGELLAGAKTFRVPRAFPVESVADVRRVLVEQADAFPQGYVLRPRVGWGGFGVQVANPGDEPRPFSGPYVLSERIVPQRADDRFWEVRMFVMGGVCLGGIKHTSRSPLTNYWQGGEPAPLDEATTARLAPAALEAVARLDAAADRIHRAPQPPDSPLIEVDYADVRTSPTR